MIEIRPNCVQNIKQNLAKQRFSVINGSVADSVSSLGPVFKRVESKKEMA